MTAVQTTRLSNGLTILTREVHSAPVTTFWVWYRVGGRNERAGITGASHWVEHMMFKGTPTLGKGEIFGLVNRNGGVNNAFTWIDYTAYFETLPADRIDLAIRIESDRMVNSLFDPAEVAAERTVIISEREGMENSPQQLLDEEVMAAAFKIHPYHHGVIGWKCDLETMSRDDLYNHYRTYYVPNNAVVVVVGDFETGALWDQLERGFGAIPPGLDPQPVHAQEPPQEGERRVVLRRPGGAHYIQVCYHVPAARHPDFFPLFVLNGVLDGVPAMGTGGGSNGRSARLYRALVEKELATEVDCSFGPTLDPGVFQVTATARPGVSLSKVEKAILAELEKVARQPVRPAELEKVKRQARAQFVYAADGVANQGYWLGSLEIVASHTMYGEFLDRLAAVTADDVQRVAATYLVETNRTVGWFVPTNV